MHHQHGEESEKGGGSGCRERGEREKKDHLEETAEQWERAFFQALQEVRVDLLKEEIKKSMGPSLGKTARGVAGALQEDWKKFWERNKELLESDEAEAHEKVVKAVRESLKKIP